MQRGEATSPSEVGVRVRGCVPLQEITMKKQMMCALALGCASVLGMASAKAQGNDQDKQFLMQASQAGYTEITFSQLAVQKATNPKVKAFAQRMVTDHTKLAQEMMPFAQQMGVAPVTSLDAEHQQLYDQLNQLSGSQFDHTYMMDMDKDHHMAETLFQNELSSTQDAAMKPTVKKGDKVIEEHTRMADKLVKEMGGTPAM